MLAETLALLADDLAGPGDIRPPPGHEIGVGALADEADLLALRLLRHRQAEIARELPHLRLGQVAERELDEVELLLRQGVEDVALVLAGVDRAEEPVRRAPLDPGVVTGRQAIGAEQLRAVDEVAELDVAVALQAGIRRPPGGVLVDEAVDDRLAELGFHIDGVERNADHVAGRAGVVHGRDAAAGVDRVHGIRRREESAGSCRRRGSHARA